VRAVDRFVEELGDQVGNHGANRAAAISRRRRSRLPNSSAKWAASSEVRALVDADELGRGGDRGARGSRPGRRRRAPNSSTRSAARGAGDRLRAREGRPRR
jgi:hypothetical protein